MSLLGAFNNQIESFSKEICEVFPNDTDLKMGHNMIILLKKTNPRKLLNIYNIYAEEFKDKIYNKEESFFLENDFNSIAEKNNKKEYTFSLVVKLKEYWSKLSDSNKEIIWKYFIVLGKLSDKLKVE
jgi:hypothetical protein